MSAEEDGRGDDSRERRGDNGRRNTPARRGGDPRGGQGGPGARKGGGPRGGAFRAGGPQGGRGRPGGGQERDARGQRDDRKPGRPFKRSDDGRSASREGRSDSRFGGQRGGERRDGRFSGQRGERKDDRFSGQGGERRDSRFSGQRDDRRDSRASGPGGGRQEGRFSGQRDERRDGRSSGQRDERRGGRASGPGGERRDGRFSGQRGERKEGRFSGPRGERGEGRFSGPRGERRDNRSSGPRGERRDGRFSGEGGERREGRSFDGRGPRAGQGGGGPRREGRPGGFQGRGGQGERRTEGRPQDRPFRGRRDDRDERRTGGQRFEGRREGRPGDRDKTFKGRGGPRRPQDGGRSYGPPRDRGDRPARYEERERPAPKHDDPLLPEDVIGDELDAEAREELRTLPKELATKVARHLVMAGRLAEEEPEQSYRHAKAARRLASRVGIVREAAGIAAYHAGEWAEALAELRAARRLGAGDHSYLPVMADCERGLGRPERALDLVKSPEAEKLDPMGRVELRIVESGVRRDMGQNEAAVVTLQIPELRDRRLRPWSVRLFYAYADALVEAGRESEASDWFARAAAADRDGDTDAAERYAELEGLHILDTEEDADGVQTEELLEAPEAEPADVPESAEAPEAEPADLSEPAELPEPADLPESADVPEPESEPVEGSATDIEFRPAEPEVRDTADESAPQAPVLFLEPKPADEERPPPDE